MTRGRRRYVPADRSVDVPHPQARLNRLRLPRFEPRTVTGEVPVHCRVVEAEIFKPVAVDSVFMLGIRREIASGFGLVFEGEVVAEVLADGLDGSTGSAIISG